MKSFAELREEYKTGKLFTVGDTVETKDGVIAEIVNLGTNYVTLVENGNIFKKWITEVTKKKVAKKKVCEGFSFKGYSPKNFSDDNITLFTSLIESSTDHYAILNCIQTVDLLLGANKKLVENNFDVYGMSFDRATKYLDKFGITRGLISNAEDILLEVAIEEGIKFTGADKSKVAYIIATSAGIEPQGDPASTVNKAAQHFKSSKLTPEGWKILGKMLAKADEAGINWNHNIFNPTTLKYMELA